MHVQTLRASPVPQKKQKGAPRTRSGRFMRQCVCKPACQQGLAKDAKGAPRTRTGQFMPHCVCELCVPTKCRKIRKRCTTHAKWTIYVPMRANFACRQDCTGRKRGHHARETSNLALECPPTLRADKAMQTTQNARAARELSNSDAKLCVPGSLAKDPNGARRRGNGQFGCKNLRPHKAMHVTESCTPQGKRIIWMQNLHQR